MVRATSYNNKIMKILVTGAKGFVGKNLCAQLNNIKDGKARCYGELKISDVFEYWIIGAKRPISYSILPG